MDKMNKKMKSIQDDIIKEFSRFDDWFDIYEHIINKGKNHDFDDETLKSEEYSIGGCQSSVWIKSQMKDGTIHFSGDSDSLIVKGILSFILEVVNDQDPKEILQSDLYFLDKLGFRSNLSPTRVNGINAIVKEIKTKAKENSK